MSQPQGYTYLQEPDVVMIRAFVLATGYGLTPDIEQAEVLYDTVWQLTQSPEALYNSVQLLRVSQSGSLLPGRKQRVKKQVAQMRKIVIQSSHSAQIPALLVMEAAHELPTKQCALVLRKLKRAAEFVSAEQLNSSHQWSPYAHRMQLAEAAHSGRSASQCALAEVLNSGGDRQL